MPMHLINIGNSKGIRLSKNIINKYHFEDGLDLIENDDGIKLIPLKKKLRKGWNEFFSKYHHQVDVDLEFLEFDIERWCEDI
jgi:antitoxin MazE